jgi:hypothetical protein
MCSALKRRSVWILLFMLSFWAGRCLPQSRTESPIVVDLRGYGWKHKSERPYDRPAIAVDSYGRVLVGFTVLAREGLISRSQPSPDFHVMRFSPDGKVDLSLSLPTHAKTINSIYFSDTDQIIARANDSIQLLQDDRGVWKGLCPAPCSASQTSSRHTLVLHTGDPDSPLTIVRFSPEPALQQCSHAAKSGEPGRDTNQNYTRFITDKFAYFPDWERWPLCDYDHRVEMPRQAGTLREVLNDDTFVVSPYVGDPYSTPTKRRQLAVVSPDGRVKFRSMLQEHESVRSIHSSSQGNIIAVDLLTIRGGNEALDIAGHVTARRIAVYDIDAGIERASIPVSPKPHYSLQFDISPDGQHLAIFVDNILKLIDLRSTLKDNQTDNLAK